jgi:chloride channel protein, CIC family
MHSGLIAFGARSRVLSGRLLSRLGFHEDSFLLVLAILIGVVTAWAAVGFHELIIFIRNTLYTGAGPRSGLYGAGILMLIMIPAAGGLAVGLISRFVFRTREGHGVIDVIESVARTSGTVRPLSAVEKILTSAVTIGTGGSAGAEGPIVQIGAGIAAWFGQFFALARRHMPVLIGCGSAAGISAIFNAPIGGVFFTLEVILLDFSLRTFTPVVLASVVANVTTKAIFQLFGQDFGAIFALPAWEVAGRIDLSWAHMGNFVLLGLLCGAVGVSLTRMSGWTEGWFGRMPIPRWSKPALGGSMLGVLGVFYVLVFGWWLLDRPKPIPVDDYPLPAFFSDGYGVIRQLVQAGPPAGPEIATAATPTLSGFYAAHSPGILLLLLGSLVVIKIVATCLTLSSGGSGGIIAPSLFLGATAGGFLGVLLRLAGMDVAPHLYALVGMGAVLAAVVHAPLASILILLELTQDHNIILPAMLATVIATGAARLIFRDSIYTMSLRLRGVRLGTMADLTLLRRLTVEQVDLEPATVLNLHDPLQNALDIAAQTGAGNFIACDERGIYAGMLVARDLNTALLQREAVPLLLVEELVRADIPLVSSKEDLATVLDMFARHDVDHLPVSISPATGRVIGVITRAGLMRRYQRALGEGA